MKLVAKTNKYYLIFFIVLFPLMIVVDYYLIQYIVNSEVNDTLKHESERIIFHVDEEGELPPSYFVYETKPLNENLLSENNFRDTLIYEDYAKNSIPYRTYEFTVRMESQKLRVSLKHVLLEMNELIVWLFITTTLIIFLLVLGLFFINQAIYKWAWKPFFESLSKLKNYDITQKTPVLLETSEISEFKELNTIVTVLMNQVKNDFQNLKEFNENISHEIQTPLAIIRNKMVLLLESQNLSNKERQRVQAVYQEANKLSKIGKSLTLISRIENQEFKGLDSVDISTIVEDIISNMEEIIQFKNIKLKVVLNPVKIKCDLILANILFTNLIKNAVQHNKEGGHIAMLLNEEKFEITNSGDISTIAPEKLFNRFKRGNSESASLGLGLAISQRICDLYGFHLQYIFQEDLHFFTLHFKGSATVLSQAKLQ